MEYNKSKHPSRKYTIRHLTKYDYAGEVQKSSNLIRLRPVDDTRQQVHSYSISIDPEVDILEFEDVFGNRVSRVSLEEPHQSLSILTESSVEVLDSDPFDFSKHGYQMDLPITWLPWQKEMLEPYLKAAELPEAHLRELEEYARSFASDQNNDLMETLFALNLTIFREYDYVPGSTTIDTTVYEVFQQKKGVCQDFTHLFLCLARLLNIPARYCCGYIFTGQTSEARATSDATHAWVQVYLPELGWKDFDPTNGILPRGEHMRVAHGRWAKDATPLVGTVEPAVAQNLTVDVQVIEQPSANPVTS
ncbi:Transglutaminase [Planctomycetales bacterium 10988]|nr:Transglutaminase [Planctomycetales bacterium 10988]